MVPHNISTYMSYTKLSFTYRVLAVVRSIPPGRVATYGDVAAMAGRPQAARSVGNIMSACRSSSVPCHRVVKSNGQLGRYSNQTIKRALLRAEGVTVGRYRLASFSYIRWQKSVG